MKIYLRDRNPGLCQMWSAAFKGCSDVEISCGDIFEGPKTDAIVSPANSFGFMNGGIDAVYTQRFGQQLEDKLRLEIQKVHEGEMPVGQALIVPTGDPNREYGWLVSTPTMPVPQDVSRTNNAYLAFRAALKAIRKHNSEGVQQIESLLCPGLCTAVGMMDYTTRAVQMRWAYDLWKGHVHTFDRLEDAYVFYEKIVFYSNTELIACQNRRWLP